MTTLEVGMRRVVIAMICLLTTSAHAQAPSASQKAVFALEEEWTRALMKNDTAAFRRLTVPGFIYTEDNAVMTQSELIKAIAASGDVVSKAWNEGMKFHDYTPAAVVTGILHVQGHNKGKAFHRRYRFTDTWLYRKGKWRAIAAQDYLIPQ